MSILTQDELNTLNLTEAAAKKRPTIPFKLLPTLLMAGLKPCLSP